MSEIQLCFSRMKIEQMLYGLPAYMIWGTMDMSFNQKYPIFACRLPYKSSLFESLYMFTTFMAAFFRGALCSHLWWFRSPAVFCLFKGLSLYLLICQHCFIECTEKFSAICFRFR